MTSRIKRSRFMAKPEKEVERMDRKIAFLGPRGTFTEEAAMCLFGAGQGKMLPFSGIPDVLEAVISGKTDYAVVPTENSIEGSVNLTMDWLIHKVDLPIWAEVVIPVRQHLLTARQENPLPLDQVRKILSHPHAVAQCHQFLRENLPGVEVEYTKSTAEAAELVSRHAGEQWAAIGNRLSSEIYDLQITRENIEDHDNNYTRFVLVGHEQPSLPISSQQKTTILVTLPADFPGALYQVLAAFAWRKINLSRIESRPTKKGLGNYHFIIDMEQGMDEVLVPGALAEIEAIGCQVRFLGSYPAYVMNNGIEQIKTG